MRDRTLITLALIFLVFTVGAGVNRSLEACSRIVGQPLAPGISEIYNKKKAVADRCIKTAVELGVKAAVRSRFLFEEVTEAVGVIRERALHQKMS